MRQAIQITIHGLVQKVGYREWLRKQAKNYQVVGWVKNLPEGTVWALLIGEDNPLQKLIQDCYQGPSSAAVQKIDQQKMLLPSPLPLIFEIIP